jgi:hypothetical protein
VIQVLQDHQTLFNNRVAPVALDVGDETDAAGIVFIGGIVQTLGNHEGLHGIFRQVKAENRADSSKHQ